MFERLILFIAAFGLSDLFVKNKSTNFKIIYYSLKTNILNLQPLFNLHEVLTLRFIWSQQAHMLSYS